MDSTNIDRLEQALAEIQTESLRLKTLIDEAKRGKQVTNIATIGQLMAETGVTLANLGSTESPKEKKVRASKGEKVPPKYINADTQVTWSGRGATPKWLKAHDAAGRNRDEFLIHKAA